LITIEHVEPKGSKWKMSSQELHSNNQNKAWTYLRYVKYWAQYVLRYDNRSYTVNMGCM